MTYCLPYRGPWTFAPEARPGLAGLMFVSDERVLPVGFAVAASRLGELARGRRLDGLSERVYNGGVEYLLRVGPAGAVPGTSRLVRVRFAVPVDRDGMMTVALRWEATGVTGGLFPALDADIRLTIDGEDQSRVTLTGSYRPPLGAVGEGLDRLLLRTVATATIRALLTRIATALEGAPPKPESWTRHGSPAWNPSPHPANGGTCAVFRPGRRRGPVHGRSA